MKKLLFTSLLCVIGAQAVALNTNALKVFSGANKMDFPAEVIHIDTNSICPDDKPDIYTKTSLNAERGGPVGVLPVTLGMFLVVDDVTINDFKRTGVIGKDNKLTVVLSQCSDKACSQQSPPTTYTFTVNDTKTTQYQRFTYTHPEWCSKDPDLN